MIKINLLEARMKEREVWYHELAENIGMSYQCLKGRCWDRTDFTRKEILSIKKALQLSDEQVLDIFF